MIISLCKKKTKDGSNEIDDKVTEKEKQNLGKR